MLDSQKIRVLHVTSTRYGIGGVEKLLLDMSPLYDQSRFDVSYCNLFCARDGFGEFPTTLRELTGSVVSIRGNRWFQTPLVFFRLLRYFRRNEFDVIHLHMIKATIIGVIVSLFLKHSKIVITRHYTRALTNHPGFVKWLDAKVTARAARVIAISDYVKQDLISEGVPEARIVKVMNGTKLAAIERPVPKFGGDPSGFRVICVGSLTRRKGHRHLIAAFRQVVNRYPLTKLTIVGEGPERERLQSQIRDLALGENIELLGFRKDIDERLAKSDLYVHPSIHEPFGIAILEAMVAELCVIATKVEGIPEIVVEQETGILVRPTDEVALAEAILERIENPTDTLRMGRRGFDRARELFGIERTVGSYQSVYYDVVGA